MEHYAHEQASAIADGARLYHLIAEGIPNMVWTAGPDGALDYFNARVFEYTGLSESELRGWGWQEAIHPGDRQRCEDRWKQSLAAGEPYRIEYRIRRGSDKAYRWHIGAALPLRNPDGRIAKWFGTCTDIEDQKRAAELLRQRQDSLEVLAAERLKAVRETDDRYRSLVEMSGDAIIVRQDDRFVYVNPAAVRLYGFRRAEELLDKVMGDFAHPDDLPKIRARAVRLAQSDEALPIEEFRLRRPDGTYATVEVLAAPFVFEGRRAVQVIMRDLSERARSEQALRERERQLSEAQRLAQLGSWNWDLATGQATWSDEMFRIFGRDPGEGVPAPGQFSCLYTAESWEHLFEVSNRSLETGAGYDLELEAVRPDGTKRWTRARAECVRGAAGTITGLRGTVQDTTDSRQAEQALRESEHRFQLFMDNSPAVAWIKDSQNRLVYLSKPYEKALGRTLASLKGLTSFEIWPEAVARYIEKNDADVLKAGVPLTLVETVQNAAGDKTHWLSVKFPLADATGAVGLAGIAIDVTDRQRLEQALKDSEAQALLAMDTAQMAHWSWNAADRRITHSGGMGPLLGLERGAQLPTVKDWMNVVHPEDRDAFLAALRTSFQTGVTLHHDWRVVKPDGRVAWILSRAQPQGVTDGSPGRMVGVAMDITERRTAQHELQQYSDRVKQLLHRLVDAQEVERRNLASALHDLIGQNLTALNIGLDILKKDLHASTGARVGRRLESMASTVEKTIDAIRDVMAELHPAVLDDYGLVPALHAQAQRFSELTGLRTRVEAFDDHPRLERKVELALYRIVQEALANAMKHSGASVVVIGIAREGDDIQLTVQDDGVGFVDPVGARSSRRGGWGLSAMRERAEAVGALLTIQFPEEGGTRVVVNMDLPDAD